MIGFRLRERIEQNLALNPAMAPETVAERFGCTVPEVLAVWGDMDRINRHLEARLRLVDEPDEVLIREWVSGRVGPGMHSWSAERCEAARRLRGQELTLAEIAERLLTTPRQVSRVLSGKCKPAGPVAQCGSKHSDTAGVAA